MNRDLLRLLLLADPGDPEYSLDRVEAAVRGGVTLVQLRAKTLSDREAVREARALLERMRSHGIPVLINDRPDIARAVGADGAHVGPEDLPPGAARSVLGPGVLGVSARTPDRVAAATAAGADYLGTGALRATSTKTRATVIGMAGIERILGGAALPVVAVGGVTPPDLPGLRAIGAAGAAVASGILGRPDPGAAARSYREAWGA